MNPTKTLDPLTRLQREKEELQRQVESLRRQPCPFVHGSDEGTHYCTLAEGNAAELNLLRVVGIAGKKWDDANRELNNFTESRDCLARAGLRSREVLALIDLQSAIRDYRKQTETKA